MVNFIVPYNAIKEDNVKNFNVEMILDIEVKEVEQKARYEGRIDGFGVPLKFDFLFKVSTDLLELFVNVGEAANYSTKMIADGLAQILKNQYDFCIVREDSQPIDPLMGTQIDEILFEPVIMAIGLSQGKLGLSKPAFRIPCICEEEKTQFQGPADILEYVLSLNP